MINLHELKDKVARLEVELGSLKGLSRPCGHSVCTRPRFGFRVSYSFILQPVWAAFELQITITDIESIEKAVEY